MRVRRTGASSSWSCGRRLKSMQRFEAALRDVLVGKGLGLASARKDTITPEDVALATTASADEAASIVARVFIDFTAPDHATLFLIDPRRGRIHVRRVTLDHGFDAVARESALFVIEESIDAILEGRDIGVSREEYQRSVAPPPPAPSRRPAPPPAPAPPAPRDAARLLLAAGYDGVALGSGAYQHAAKLVVAARLARVQISAAARFAAPLSIAGDGVQAELWTGGVSVSGAASCSASATVGQPRAGRRRRLDPGCARRSPRPTCRPRLRSGPQALAANVRRHRAAVRQGVGERRPRRWRRICSPSGTR